MFLEFYVFGEGDWLGVCAWEGGGGGGTKHFISFEGGIKYFPTLFFWGGVPNFMVEFWNTLPPPPVHILYDRSIS